MVARGLLSDNQLDAALTEQANTKEFLGALLVRRGIIKEEAFLNALAEQFEIEVVTLKDRYIDWAFVKGFSPSLLLDYKCLPIERTDIRITFAITNPLDAWALNKAEEEARGMKAEFVLVGVGDMEAAIVRYKEYMRGFLSNRSE